MYKGGGRNRYYTRRCIILKGTVKMFKSQSNFGFIETEDLDEDVFFHVSEIEGESIDEGTEVEFDQEDGDRGPKATNVEEL
jgi:CspA family cold shock protein